MKSANGNGEKEDVSAAIAEAVRNAVALSTAVAKAEELGAIIELQIKEVRIGSKTIRQVLVLPIRM